MTLSASDLPSSQSVTLWVLALQSLEDVHCGTSPPGLRSCTNRRHKSDELTASMLDYLQHSSKEIWEGISWVTGHELTMLLLP